MAEPPPTHLSCDLAVVGGGPAGLSAALAASRQGARVILLDESSQPGGQYYRQLPHGWSMATDRGVGSEQRHGADLIERLRASSCQVLGNCLAYGLHDHVLSCVHLGRPLEIEAAYVVVAAGAYDLPVPLPGWTTPGVMTAGALHSLAAGQGVVPSGRILMAGNGPLVLKFTADLLRWGANVVGLVEAAEPQTTRRLVPVIAAARHDLRRLLDGARYRATLARHRVRLHHGSAITEILGAERVTGAAFTAIDSSGRPVADAVQRVDCDAVCLGYGLAPSDELLELAGCDFAPAPAGAGAVRTVVVDACGQTSLDWLYAAGDGVAIAGGPAALAAGTVAGLTVAARLGSRAQAGDAQTGGAQDGDAQTGDAQTGDAQIRRAARTLAAHRRFQLAVAELYATRLDLTSLITPETLLCRCEELTAAEVLDAARTDGAEPLAAARALTRAGMGPCQGRNCQRPIRALLEREGFAGAGLRELARRLPARLVAVEAMAQPAAGDLDDIEMTRDQTTLPPTLEESHRE